MLNGIIPPRSDEGMYVCKKCRTLFTAQKQNPIGQLLGIGQKCPSCGSHSVKRSSGIFY